MAVNAQLPPPAPVYSWTGLYGGGNIGYRWGDARTDFGGDGSVTICCNTGWKASAQYSRTRFTVTNEAS